jgi:thiamine biosynthesis lipoprotein
MDNKSTRRRSDAAQPEQAQWGGIVGQRTFRAMNTGVRIMAIDWRQSALLADAERVFHDVEARFSRFSPDSELSAFNTRSSQCVAVSMQMLQLFDLALFFHRRTGGLFDPAVLPQLEAAGYDRSFEQIARDDPDAPRCLPVQPMSIAQVVLDRKRRTVTAPEGMRVDFGGIGKGYAVDVAVEKLRATDNFLVDAGGDIFASGDGPDGDGWPIGVADPVTGEDMDVVTLRDQAIATSTTAARRWRRGGAWRNHIIDPRTGESTRSAVLSASVIASTATEADIYAKCALMLGPGEGRRFLETQRVRGLLVLQDGSVMRSAGWPSIAPVRSEGSQEVCHAE